MADFDCFQNYLAHSAFYNSKNSVLRKYED